jgi:DNA-binding NarL/FixJ family response regulator
MNDRISVLLIERDPQSAQLLLLLLAAPDARRIETMHVQGVEEGLRRLEDDEPADAVLLGLPLGEGRPRERLRALRRKAPGVPVVVVVDPGEEALGRQAVEQGATSFWVRSADARSVKRAVAAAIARATRTETSAAASPVLEAAAAAG